MDRRKVKVATASGAVRSRSKSRSRQTTSYAASVTPVAAAAAAPAAAPSTKQRRSLSKRPSPAPKNSSPLVTSFDPARPPAAFFSLLRFFQQCGALCAHVNATCDAQLAWTDLLYTHGAVPTLHLKTQQQRFGDALVDALTAPAGRDWRMREDTRSRRYDGACAPPPPPPAGHQPFPLATDGLSIHSLSVAGAGPSSASDSTSTAGSDAYGMLYSPPTTRGQGRGSVPGNSGSLSRASYVADAVGNLGSAVAPQMPGLPKATSQWPGASSLSGESWAAQHGMPGEKSRPEHSTDCPLCRQHQQREEKANRARVKQDMLAELAEEDRRLAEEALGERAEEIGKVDMQDAPEKVRRGHAGKDRSRRVQTVLDAEAALTAPFLSEEWALEEKNQTPQEKQQQQQQEPQTPALPLLLESVLAEGPEASLALTRCPVCAMQLHVRSAWLSLHVLQLIDTACLARHAVLPMHLPHDVMAVTPAVAVAHHFHAMLRLALSGDTLPAVGLTSRHVLATLVQSTFALVFAGLTNVRLVVPMTSLPPSPTIAEGFLARGAILEALLLAFVSPSGVREALHSLHKLVCAPTEDPRGDSGSEEGDAGPIQLADAIYRTYQETSPSTESDSGEVALELRVVVLLATVFIEFVHLRDEHEHVRFSEKSKKVKEVITEGTTLALHTRRWEHVAELLDGPVKRNLSILHDSADGTVSARSRRLQSLAWMLRAEVARLLLAAAASAGGLASVYAAPEYLTSQEAVKRAIQACDAAREFTSFSLTNPLASSLAAARTAPASPREVTHWRLSVAQPSDDAPSAAASERVEQQSSSNQRFPLALVPVVWVRLWTVLCPTVFRTAAADLLVLHASTEAAEPVACVPCGRAEGENVDVAAHGKTAEEMPRTKSVVTSHQRTKALSGKATKAPAHAGAAALSVIPTEDAFQRPEDAHELIAKTSAALQSRTSEAAFWWRWRCFLVEREPAAFLAQQPCYRPLCKDEHAGNERVARSFLPSATAISSVPSALCAMRHALFGSSSYDGCHGLPRSATGRFHFAFPVFDSAHDMFSRVFSPSPVATATATPTTSVGSILPHSGSSSAVQKRECFPDGPRLVPELFAPTVQAFAVQHLPAPMPPATACLAHKHHGDVVNEDKKEQAIADVEVSPQAVDTGREDPNPVAASHPTAQASSPPPPPPLSAAPDQKQMTNATAAPSTLSLDASSSTHSWEHTATTGENVLQYETQMSADMLRNGRTPHSAPPPAALPSPLARRACDDSDLSLHEGLVVVAAEDRSRCSGNARRSLHENDFGMNGRDASMSTTRASSATPHEQHSQAESRSDTSADGESAGKEEAILADTAMETQEASPPAPFLVRHRDSSSALRVGESGSNSTSACGFTELAHTHCMGEDGLLHRPMHGMISKSLRDINIHVNHDHNHQNSKRHRLSGTADGKAPLVRSDLPTGSAGAKPLQGVVLLPAKMSRTQRRRQEVQAMRDQEKQACDAL